MFLTVAKGEVVGSKSDVEDLLTFDSSSYSQVENIDHGNAYRPFIDLI